MATPRKRPVIGLTTYSENAELTVWKTHFAALHSSYVDVIHAAGGIAMLLPPQQGEVADEAASRIDALVITGGADVSPARYGQPRGVHTGEPRYLRDQWEEALLRASSRLDLPILGICRGMQLINVAFGGSLHQHLPDLLGSCRHQPQPGRFGAIEVTLEPCSQIGKALGAQISVQCHHHQAIDALAPHLIETGWADDGTIEAIESPLHRYLVGVQWHPEQQTGDVPLFDSLIDAARREPMVWPS